MENANSLIHDLNSGRYVRFLRQQPLAPLILNS